MDSGKLNSVRILLHRSTTGNNYYVRILSTIDRELLKPNASVALQKVSSALVDVLPPEADSSISMLKYVQSGWHTAVKKFSSWLVRLCFCVVLFGIHSGSWPFFQC